jgi:hypothetical protein
MANDSFERNALLASCHFLEKVEVIVHFPSEKFMINNILVILANCILIISTILLNAVSIITILKSSQLKRKPCYFIILVQTFIDLAVGVFAIPLFVTFLASQVNGVSNCVAAFISLRLAFPPVGASIITLSALTVERYVAILHPYSYIKLVTKKRILIYVASGSVLVLFVASLSVLVRRLIHYFSSAIILLFFVLTTFAHTKIFLVIRSLSQNSQNRPHDHVSTGNLKKKKLLLREIKQAKSCFIIVTCFVGCLFPTVVAFLSFAFKLLDRFNAEAIRIWAISFLMSNSSVNSALFFWTKKMLRKEARKVLKTLRLRMSVEF